MKAIPAQEIKRKGISAVDQILEEGAVHVIKNNKPQYVVLTEERYQELLVSENEAYLARVRASLKDVKAGKVSKFRNAQELLKAIDQEQD